MSSVQEEALPEWRIDERRRTLSETRCVMLVRINNVIVEESASE